jgi:ABC-type xylose transport system substrate-binding protein
MGRFARRKVASAVLVLAAALALAGCGQAQPSAGTASAGLGTNPAIAFLMPDQASTRYERYDYPLFQAKVDDLCVRCDVLYTNAEGDPDKQRQQAKAALDQGATVLVLAAVQPQAAVDIVKEAHARGAKVVAYDRPIVEVPADHYVSYDNEAIGELITRSLLDRIKDRGIPGGVLQVNGAPEDAAADQVQIGIKKVMDASPVPVLATYDTPDWDADKAEDWVSGQIGKLGAPQIAGVIAGNDGVAGGTYDAFQAAGVSPVPPITGNDSELAAAQRILRGEQYNTISKPIRVVAEAGAAAAVQLVHGQDPPSSGTLYDTPTELFQPTIVTAANLRGALIDTGELELGTVCTPDLRSACERAGLQ